MKSKMIVLFLLVRVIVYGQADSTDIIVQKMMKEQKTNEKIVGEMEKDVSRLKRFTTDMS